jgi:hypothetical protein
MGLSLATLITLMATISAHAEPKRGQECRKAYTDYLTKYAPHSIAKSQWDGYWEGVRQSYGSTIILLPGELFVAAGAGLVDIFRSPYCAVQGAVTCHREHKFGKTSLLMNLLNTINEGRIKKTKTEKGKAEIERKIEKNTVDLLNLDLIKETLYSIKTTDDQCRIKISEITQSMRASTHLDDEEFLNFLMDHYLNSSLFCGENDQPKFLTFSHLSKIVASQHRK